MILLGAKVNKQQGSPPRAARRISSMSFSSFGELWRMTHGECSRTIALVLTESQLSTAHLKFSESVPDAAVPRAQIRLDARGIVVSEGAGISSKQFGFPAWSPARTLTHAHSHVEVKRELRRT